MLTLIEQNCLLACQCVVVAVFVLSGKLTELALKFHARNHTVVFVAIVFWTVCLSYGRFACLLFANCLLVCVHVCALLGKINKINNNNNNG